MSSEQLAQLQRETRSSIEVTRNSKGDYQWVIKCYFDEGEEVHILDTIQAIDRTLRITYLPEAAS